jgi:tetratricopeptide (TPR) repeat protein
MLRPNDPTTALFIGLCYKDLKDIDQSLSYMNFAARTAIPYFMSDIYNQLGILYGLKREFKKSIEALKEAYRLDSTKVDVLFKIATTYEEFQKDKTNALNYYNSYLKAMKEENDYQKSLKVYALERKRVIKEYQIKYGKQQKK